MSAPIITGVVLTGLGAFIGGLVVTGLGVLIVLRSVNYNAQSRVS
jgi:hypothetical protein